MKKIDPFPLSTLMMRVLLVAAMFCFLQAAIGYAKHPRVYPPAPATVPTTAPVSHAGPKYIFGVFAQPVYMMPGLKIIGFNTLVSIPLNHPAVDWATAATAQGFYQIRPAVGVKALDEDNPLWIAWENPDEPDLHATSQAVIDANYAKAKAAGVATFTNFDGSRVLWVQPQYFGDGASYASILAKTDWACSDIYPAAGWNIDPATKHNGAIDLWSPGYATDTLRELKGDEDNSRLLMYVEVCRQRQWRSPTGDELRTILKQAERRNLRGVVIYACDENLRWGEPSGKPNAFFGADAEHREILAEWIEAHAK